jgi:ribulose-phosphate 3-epimerase
MGIATDLRKVKLLAPSILSADFARLGEEVDLVLDMGVRLVHVDVMDGHFVPNLTVGPAVVAALAPRVHDRGAFLDVHLMIEDPDRFLADFAEAGADALSVHVETCPHLHRTLTAIRDLGLSAGIAVNPATDVSVVGEALNFCDYLLAMSVNPGFGGQRFIPDTIHKLRRLRAMLPAGVALEVDGGVGRDNIFALAAAGANWVVAGSAVFHRADPAEEITVLTELLNQ